MTETPAPTLAQALDDLVAVQTDLCNATDDKWHEVLRIRDKQFFALRNHLEELDAALPALLADRARLDWLDTEHTRIDPVASLVVKAMYQRSGSSWANCNAPIRAEMDRAITAVRLPCSESTDTNG